MNLDPNQETHAAHPVPATPAGWYPDPNDAYSQRYWDGSGWTDHRAPGTAVAAPVHVAPKPPTSGQATASMVLGILGLLGLYLIGPVLALVFGHMAKRDIEASGGTLGGAGMATAGIVMGWIGVGFTILFVVLWLIIGFTFFGLSTSAS